MVMMPFSLFEQCVMLPYTSQVREHCLPFTCGDADLDDFFEHFGIEVLDEEDMPQTVNGLIMKELGSFPRVGDSLEYKNLQIEIKKIGTKRIEEVHVTKIAEEEKGAE